MRATASGIARRRGGADDSCAGTDGGAIWAAPVRVHADDWVFDACPHALTLAWTEQSADAAARAAHHAPDKRDPAATMPTSCREEMADLEALHREFGPRRLRVVAVSVEDADGDRVRRFVAQQRLTMPVAHDPSGLVRERYQVMAVPETYLVGGDGRLRWRQAGGLHGAPEAARRAVQAGLAGGP